MAGSRTSKDLTAVTVVAYGFSAKWIVDPRSPKFDRQSECVVFERDWRSALREKEGRDKGSCRSTRSESFMK